MELSLVWPFPAKLDSIPSKVDGLVYAIGDIHGRSDLLDLMIRDIRDDLQAERAKDPVLVLLGDYVDRGGDSAGVIERLVSLEHDRSLRLIALKGNHEQLLLRFLEGQAVGPRWAAYGGGAALQSYGVPTPRPGDAQDWEDARSKLIAAMPHQHLRLVKQLELWAEIGDYLFVHAGVRPGVPMQAQTERDLLWIRGPFLRARQACDRVVVHGHTPAKQVYLGRHRIGLDTGAFATGLLSSVRLQGTSRVVVQVDGG